MKIISQPTEFLLYKMVVKIDIVSDKNPSRGQLNDRPRNFKEAGGTRHHGVGNSGQPCDMQRNVHFGIYKGHKTAGDGLPIVNIKCYFGDFTVLINSSGGFYVDYRVQC